MINLIENPFQVGDFYVKTISTPSLYAKEVEKKFTTILINYSSIRGLWSADRGLSHFHIFTFSHYPIFPQTSNIYNFIIKWFSIN